MSSLTARGASTPERVFEAKAWGGKPKSQPFDSAASSQSTTKGRTAGGSEESDCQPRQLAAAHLVPHFKGGVS